MKPTWRVRRVQAVAMFAAALGTLACTSDPQASEEQGGETSSTNTQLTTTQLTTTQLTTTQSTSEDQEVIDEPAVRPADNPDDGSANHWIGRGLMTASSVELVWSPIDGNEVSYRVHRFARGDGFDPETADLGESTIVYDGTDTAFTDRDVEAGLFFYYLLEATVDGQVLPLRWTEALTEDDTEPPTPVTGLSAVTTDDGVLLSWDPSSDNVEFAAYAVSIVDGENETYIGGGADLGQTSFLDDRASTFPVTYSVVAVDFHDNRSVRALLTVSGTE